MRRVCLVFWLLLPLVLVYCTLDTQPGSDQSREQSGAELAKVYCASCHLYPQPNLLDKSTWANFVLIRMAAFMGIYEDNTRYYDQMPKQWLEPGPGGERVKAAHVYPDKPALSRQDWEKIKAFYLENAPKKLASAPSKTAIQKNIPFFKSRTFTPPGTVLPLIYGIGVDQEARQLYFSVYQGGIHAYDFSGKQKTHWSGNTYISQIEPSAKSFISLDMGTRIASDYPKGQLKMATDWEDFRQNPDEVLIDSLMRPVHFSKGDLNGDGQADFVISEFGNLLGQLALYTSGKDGKSYDKKILFPDDGAVRSELLDFNDDGQTDILALQANADEGIDLYLNRGSGEFDRQRLLRFPPSYGSTYFESLDFNGDGQKDLLVCHGDNGDYTPLLKPYHGIRVYLQQNGTFEETIFLPLNGVYQATARDFDLDGDLDIAAVSFHPDFKHQPEESFVLFVNEGTQKFHAYTIPQYADSRWMRFVVVDIEEDGDEDILVTAFNIKSPEVPMAVAQRWEQSDAAVLLLENTTVD